MIRKIFVRKILRRDLEKKIRFYQQIQSLLVDDPVIQLNEFNGEFEIGKESTLLRRILTNGHYEPKLADLCRNYVNENSDAIDVGANIGFYSVLFAQLINQAQRVLAVEPTAEAFKRLQNNLKRNHLSDKVITFNGVVSNSSTPISINSVPGKEEYSSIGSMTHPSIKNENFITYKVKSETLDHLVQKFDLKPGFLKIDVEGAEKLVIDGATETISNYKPVILAEVSNELLQRNGSSRKEVFQALGNYGYRIIDPKTPLKKPSLTKPFGDILCVPKEIT